MRERERERESIRASPMSVHQSCTPAYRTKEWKKAWFNH
jgi:hypothetical protein